jgi:hypothetical protein
LGVPFVGFWLRGPFCNKNHIFTSLFCRFFPATKIKRISETKKQSQKFLYFVRFKTE